MTKIGVTLPQFTDDPERLVSGALAAEELGLDSMWVFDHLWPLGGTRDRPIFEAWTTLAYLAARTERIKIGTLVSRSTLRNPALLAKMAATIETVVPGRLIVALGSGDELSRPENEAFGIPYYSGDDRVAEMIAAVGCVRECLLEPEATVLTPYHHIERLPTSPRPSPPPPVWIGGRSRPVRKVAGGLCDGWNSWSSSPETFEREARTVRAAAGGRGVELTWGGQVILAAGDAQAKEMLGDRPEDEFVVGAPATVAARLRSLIAAGAEHLIVAFPYAGRPSYELLAGPVRELLK
jgi:alkanesulfonate monooxygenase SsuD/methylene tetrahydromethanopterin reductase-like flavin-dependent oxidoreductase (luciferase family)